VKKEIIIATFWLLFGLYLSVAASELGLGTFGRPGPGFFPFGAAIAIGLVALPRLLRVRGQTPSATLATPGSQWRKIACIIVGMAAYGFLLEPLGFALCTFLLMTFYLKIIALQRWRRSLGFAVAVALLAHLFFDTMLNAPLPRGVLDLLM